MKIFLDLFSIVIFFITYIYYGIFHATAIMMVLYTINLIISYISTRKIDKTLLITWLLVVVLGGLTLLLHNAEIIKYKPTLIYWFFAIGLHISPYLKDEKSIMEHMIGHQLKLPKQVWTKLNNFWTAFFYILGFLNLYLAYTLTTEQWVYFKTFGIIGLLLVATVVQVIYLAKYIED